MERRTRDAKVAYGAPASAAAVGSASGPNPAMVRWQELVAYGASISASDVFWKPGSPPFLRVKGVVQPLNDFPELTQVDTEWLAKELMSSAQREAFQEYPERDLGLTIGETCRLRINIFRERGHIALVMRIIPLRVPTIEELELPEALKSEYIAMRPQGLILVTGPTGCGKSTTLAAMLDHINANRRAHILTIEDPIEYVHKNRQCLVSQREVGIDTAEFQDALKYAMRQSPDVILIGEMRDMATFNTCMQAAETGHLVFATVHTTSAAETMERIINMYPPTERPQVCMRLSRSLAAVLSQSLVPRKDKPGRVAALEIMVVTPTVQKYIEEGKPSDVYDAIEEGAHWGMQTKNQALLKLYAEGKISANHAMFYAGNYTEMRQMLRRHDGEQADAARQAEAEAARAARAEAARQRASGQAQDPEAEPGPAATSDSGPAQS